MKFFKSTILIFCLLTSIYTITGVINENTIDQQNHRNDKINEDTITTNQYTMVSPIYIDSNSNFTATATARSWVGTGTLLNPIIIENIEIQGDYSNNAAIFISFTDLHFVIRNSFFNGTYNGVYLDSVYNAVITNNIFSNHLDSGIYLDGIIDQSIFSLNEISSSDIGIFAYNSINFIIKDNIAHNNRYGIYTLTTTHITIENNEVYNNELGIFTTDGANNTIIRNTAYSNEQGILVDRQSISTSIPTNVTENTAYWNLIDGITGSFGKMLRIYQNTIYQNGNGLKIFFGSEYEVFENNIYDNAYGMYLDSPEYPNITMNTLTNNGFFIAHFSNNLIYQKINTLDSNLVNGKPVAYYNHSSGLSISGNYGQILLVDVTDSVVESNDIYNASVGVFLSHSSDITVSNNNLENNTEGVGVYYSDNNTISNNTIWGSSHEGINVVTSTNTSILKNDIYLNKNGISGFEADFIDISKNLIHDNLENGLHLDTGTNTTILHNLIYKNGFNSSSVIVQTENVDRSLGLNFISSAIFKFNQSVFTLFMTNLFIAYNTIAGNLGYGLYLQYGFGGGTDSDVMSNDFIDNNQDQTDLEAPKAHIYTTEGSFSTANYFNDAAKAGNDGDEDGLLDDPTIAVVTSDGTTIDTPSLASPVKNHHFLSAPRIQAIVEHDAVGGSSLIIKYGGAVDTLGHAVEYTILVLGVSLYVEESAATITVPIGGITSSKLKIIVIANSDLRSEKEVEINIDLSKIKENPSSTNPTITSSTDTDFTFTDPTSTDPTTSKVTTTDNGQLPDKDDSSDGFLFSPWNLASILGFGAFIAIIRRRKLFD